MDTFHISFVLFAVLSRITLSSAAISNEKKYDIEQRVKEFLLERYDKSTPPQPYANQPINISVGMALINVENLDEENGILTSHVWIRNKWTDERLKWNKPEYNISGVAVPINKLWMPDIVPYNYAGDQFRYTSDYLGNIRHDGTVFFVPHIRLQTKCTVDLTSYPFDQQNCTIMMGSWIYNSKTVILKADMGTAVDNNYEANTVWELVQASEKVVGNKYPCCEEYFYDHRVSIILRRHSHILVHMYVGPGVCLGLMIPVIFMLPAFSTYKLILGGTLLIAQVLMMNQLADSLPTSHVTAPTISLYMLANIVLLSLSLACSTVIISCWEKAKKGGVGVPAGIDKVFLGIFGRLMCVRREDYIDDSDTGGAPRNVISDDANVQTDDSAAMVKEYTRLVAPAEWRQLSVVCDRLLFVIFVLITVVTMAAMVKYTY